MATSFLKAMLEHLTLPGETLAQFRDQLKNLTDQDKMDLRESFAKEGVIIDA